MKKRFLTAMLTGAFLLASSSVFVACSSKDYDDDIAKLQSQIDNIQKTVDQINTQITNGSVITDVVKGTDGITIKLSDGTSYNITNGEDGEDGESTVITIGDNGNWFLNGVDTGKPSRGEKGDKGDQGDKGDKGDQGATGETGPQGPAGTSTATYYYPCTDTANANYGYWVKVENGVETKGDKWLVEGVLTAIYDVQTGLVTLDNVKGFNGPLTLATNNRLRGLVFIGDEKVNNEIIRAYVDAVPTIRIQSFKYNPLTLSNKDSKNEKANAGTNEKAINPETYAYYHVNPANVSQDDLKNLSYAIRANGVYEASGTRANASSDFDVTPEFVELTTDGVLKVKVVVKGSPATYEKISTVALQATKNVNLNEDGTVDNTKAQEVVTSDYAAIFDNDMDALRIAKKVRKNNALVADVDYDFRRAVVGIAGRDANAAKGSSIWNRTEINNKKVWDIDANFDAENEGKDIDLYLDYSKEFDLNDSVEIHKVTDPHAVADFASLGLEVKYEVVDEGKKSPDQDATAYSIGSNKTPQHQFITLNGSKVSARVYSDTQNKTAAIGRTPIVRVTLSDPANNSIVEVAYIKIKWIRVASAPEPIESKYFDMNNFDFKCKDITNISTVEQTNRDLYNALGMDSKTFHQTYTVFEAHNPVDTDYPQNVGTVAEGTQIINGETTYILKWTITGAEMYAHGNGEVTHTIVYKNSTGTRSQAITLRATITGVEKTFNIDKADFITEYWDDNKTFTRFNVAVPQSTNDRDPNHCVFVNDLNSPFTTVNGILKINNVKSVTFKFDENASHGMKTITKMANHNVKFDVRNGGLELWATVSGVNTPYQMVAEIKNNNPNVPFNTVELQETDAAKALLNDQDANNPFYALYIAQGKICGNAGEIAEQDCEITFAEKDHFQANWIRPVHISPLPADNLIDGVDFGETGSFITLEKLVDLFDWRTRYFKNYDSYWDYYGVTKIDVKKNAAGQYVIKTNLNGGADDRFDLPNTVSVAVYDKNGRLLPGHIGPDLPDPFTFSTSSKYGYFAYSNNGTKTEKDFYIFLQVVVSYKWGDVVSTEIPVLVQAEIK